MAKNTTTLSWFDRLWLHVGMDNLLAVVGIAIVSFSLYAAYIDNRDQTAAIASTVTEIRTITEEPVLQPGRYGQGLDISLDGEDFYFFTGLKEEKAHFRNCKVGDKVKVKYYRYRGRIVVVSFKFLTW